MKSLRIKDGDLSVSTGRTADFVYEKDKLIQDLTLWLNEPIGIGFSTPSFGSTLGEFIGTSDPEEAQSAVEAEVIRVLRLYQNWQLERLREAKNLDTLQFWSRQEIINQIVSVESRVIYDEIRVTIHLKTLADTEILLSGLLTSDGVQLSV